MFDVKMLAALVLISACDTRPTPAEPEPVRPTTDAGSSGSRVMDAGAPRRVADAAWPYDAALGVPVDAETRRALDFTGFDQAVERAMGVYNGSDAGTATPMRGAGVAVVDRERILHARAFGAHAADRVYLVASSSKILSAGVLLALASRGQLDLDAPLSRYLNDWGDTAASRVTAAQLLSNSSGLPALAEVTGALSNPFSPYLSNLCQFLPLGTLQECGKTLYGTPPPRMPDREFTYGGSGWQLAGALAEVVSGKSWAELVNETYVEPCGARTLGYTNQFARSARSYPMDFEGDVSSLDVTDNPNIEGGAYASAADYGKILQLFLNDGTCGTTRVITSALARRMREDRVLPYGGKTVSPSSLAYGEGYGLGWWVAEDYVVDPGTYGAFAWLDERRGIAAVIITEAGHVAGGELALRAKAALDLELDR